MLLIFFLGATITLKLPSASIKPANQALEVIVDKSYFSCLTSFKYSFPDDLF